MPHTTHKIARYELDPQIEYIKIHGLQRSGTNYVTHLVNENYESTKALVNIGGWKHGHYCAPWTLGQEVHVLTVVKNPYSWLVSLYNYWGPNKACPSLPCLIRCPFEEFLKSRAIFGEKSGVPYQYRAASPIHHWNNMNHHWMSIRMNTKRVCMLPYESLVENPQEVVIGVADYFGLIAKREFVNCEKQFEPSDEVPQTTSRDFDAKHYRGKGYMDMYTPDLLQYVNEQLDLDLMRDLGYEKEAV